jgi:hypothetical protein
VEVPLGEGAAEADPSLAKPSLGDPSLGDPSLGELTDVVALLTARLAWSRTSASEVPSSRIAR